MTYSDQRQTDHLADPIGTEQALSAVADAMGIAWLEQPGDEPVRDLWRRRDALAVNQLVILGKSILDARRIDEGWTRNQLRKVKADRNNRKGAAFEIVALSMLDVEGRSIRPTRANAAGYDAIVTYADGGELALSFKNYGTSAHERRFHADATTLEATFIANLRASGRNGLVLVALADGYPAKDDWAALRTNLPELIASHDGRRGGFWKGGPWDVRTLDPPDDVLPLNSRNTSYQVVIAVPFHANEEKNLIDKLEEAASNARRHAFGGADMERAVLVHLPETFPMRACTEWAQSYLDANQDGPIDQVFLHQLQVGVSGEESVMVHTFAAGVNVARLQERASNRVLAFKVHVGVASNDPAPLVLRGAEDVILDRMYCHQHGEFWTSFTASERGHLSNPAPGIFRHALMRTPDGGELSLAGIFPPSGSVTLLD